MWTIIIDVLCDGWMSDWWSIRKILVILLVVGIGFLVITWPTSTSLELNWSRPQPIPDQVQVGQRHVYPDRTRADASNRHAMICALATVHQGERISVQIGDQTFIHQVAGWHVASIAITPVTGGVTFEYHHW